MLERFRRSIELVKASIGVLRADKELLVFPAVSFVVMIVVTLTFALPLLLTGTVGRLSEGAFEAFDVVLAALFYVVSYTVIFFFNTALVGAALIRLDGGDPTLRDGFRIASSRLPAIIGYALIAATVGMILRWISERGGIIGQIAVGFVGFAWNIATFLVVPVLVVEGFGPLEAIKRSSSLLRKTWGEQIVGNIGISLVFGLLALAVILAGGLLVALLISAAPVLAVVVVVLLVIVVLGIGLIAAAVSGIFTASVYRYATRGDGGTMFNSQTLAATFRSKNAR
ncbi:MAG TPA: DUF6159 family protein [Candidatus Limnocylindria bacterium]|nr:DUF6159 family protein [Candidatus Limnocylindria bacterium]